MEFSDTFEIMYNKSMTKPTMILSENLPVPKSPRLEDGPYLDIIGEDHMMDPDMIPDPKPKKDYAFRD